MSGMSSDDRKAHRKFLEARIAENRRQLKEILGRGPDRPAVTLQDVGVPADMPDSGELGTSTMPHEFTAAEGAPTAFPRSRTMRWAFAHPAEAAVVGVAGAALLGLGPIKLARWAGSTRAVRAGAGFMQGVRQGVGVMQPLLPLLTAWMGHKWRSAERQEATRDVPRGRPSY